MAQTLELSYSTTTLDLLSGDIRLRSAGLEIETADGKTWTVLELIGVAADDATLRSTKITFDQFIERARMYAADTKKRVPVLFTWRSEGEADKQTIIYDGSSRMLTDAIYTPMLGHGGEAILRISIQHEGTWETPSDSTDGDTAVSAAGGTVVLSSLGGSVNGRISHFNILYGTGSPMTRVWVGMRRLNEGTTGFIATWEAEDGTALIDTSSSSSDPGSMSGGSKMVCDFSTGAGMYHRLKLAWGDVASSNYADIIGKYLVLGRLRLDSGSEVVVDLRHGWGGEASVGFTFLSAVDDTSLVNWNLIPLGVVNVPDTGDRDGVALTGSMMANYAIKIYAEKLSSSAALHMDCFYFVPQDFMLTAEGVGVDGTNGKADFYVGQDGFKSAISVNSTSVYQQLTYSFEAGDEDWAMPWDGALVVICAQGPTAHDLTAEVDLSFTMRARWRSYRS